MHPLFGVFGMAFLLMIALMLVSYLKEGGTVRTFGAFVFSYVHHKALNFFSTWVLLAGLMNVLRHVVSGSY